MCSMHSAQRKVELRRLGKQLHVLGKANSLCKIVKLCVFCLFVKLVWAALGPGINISHIIVTVAKYVYRLDDVLKYQLHPLVVVKNTNSRFLRFSVRSVPLFRSLMLTPMPLLVDNPRRSRRLQPTAPPEESGRTSRLYPDLTAHDTEIHPEQGTLSREDLRRRRLERFA